MRARRFSWLVVLLTACVGADDPTLNPRQLPETPRAAATRLIGLVGTMTGPEGWRGEDAFEGADLAVQALNQSLGDGETLFELRPLDDRGDPGRAINLVEQLADLDRTVGVVYAGPPQALPATEPALAAAGIPALLCYGDLYGARRLSGHVFQVSPSVLWEARRIAAYVLDDRRYRKIGLLRSESLRGLTAERSLRRALRDRGGRLGFSTRYPANGEVDVALARLRRTRVEALVVEAEPAVFGALVRALRRSGSLYKTTGRARILSAGPRLRRRRRRGDYWKPQIIGFDQAISTRSGARMPPGTVASDSYARGAHYLPVPSFQRFRRAFRRWWESDPLNWELRAYEAVRLIGWAAGEAEPGEDRARALEGLRGRRFGGSAITFGPDDHTSVDQTDVGLWVVPRARVRVRERARLPNRLYWVPLARGFSIDGQDLDLPAREWRYLVRKAPPPSAPPPRFSRLRFGVTTPRSDPVH